MGTSASKPDAPPRSPLIPPWAEQDPTPPPPVPPDEDDEVDNPAEPNNRNPEQAPPLENLPPRRFNGFRRRLSNYISTGDKQEARKALGHWVSTAMGGAAAGTRRLSRSIRIGGEVLTGLSRAAADQPPVQGQFDLRDLAGQPSDFAIGRIVDAFCPAGIPDEDAIRSAVGETLSEVLSGADSFDPASIDQNTVRVTLLALVSEIVFVTVASDCKDALNDLPPVLAIERENGLRALIREASDIVGTEMLANVGDLLNATIVTNLVSEVVRAVNVEMESWE